MRQRDITHQMRNDMKADMIVKYLNAWRLKGYVQRFRIEGKAHRPTTMWRATEDILKLEI